MSSRNAREVEKCRVALANMLKRPENRHCADCGVKQPTWASTNIGVFVCLTCSGHHRCMGTHISKGGNISVNSRYEASMPRGSKASPHDSSYTLEQYIRNKYQHKRWYSDAVTVNDPQSSNSSSNEPNERRSRSSRDRSSNGNSSSTRRTQGQPRTRPKPKVKPVQREPEPQPIAPVEEVPDLLNVGTLQQFRDNSKPKSPEDFLDFSNAMMGSNTISPITNNTVNNSGSSNNNNMGSPFGFMMSSDANAAHPLQQQQQPDLLQEGNRASSILSKYHSDNQSTFMTQMGNQQRATPNGFLTQLPQQQQQMNGYTNGMYGNSNAMAQMGQMNLQPQMGAQMGFVQPQNMGFNQINPYTVITPQQQTNQRFF